ncbi:flagellar export protein FliJ [Georgenia yuyongxinii]|uniref:Flagellar FliJ protein n=1 Tax=Georgenia yuyongxinii TaxID=2589797 RepID=A0A552WSD8_9MICO|nr:flagellar FliJ family protein [Georgenia yuyongxinii]TRW45626.1 flagellar export protein FliJ [Georgenia yuyongxinii]
MSTFRLAGLGRLRRLQEDHAAAELARRATDRRGADRRTSDARDRLAGTVLSGTSDPQSWRAAVAARAAMSATVIAAQAAAEVAAEHETLAQSQWVAARKRSKTVEKLAERHRDEEQVAELRAEQQVLDEMATQRAARRVEEES